MYTVIRSIKIVVASVLLVCAFLLLVVVEQSVALPVLSFLWFWYVLERAQFVVLKATWLLFAVVVLSSVFVSSSVVVFVLLSGSWLGTVLIDSAVGRKAITRISSALVGAIAVFFLAGGGMTWSVVLYGVLLIPVLIWISRKGWLLPSESGPWYIR